MKHLNTYITEYIVKKKLDKAIDSEDHYKYFPKTKDDLIYNIKNLINQDIYDFNCIDTSAITDMSYVFPDITRDIGETLKNIDVSGWDVSNVKNMENIFCDFTYFDCDLSYWNVSNVINMEKMFEGCENFKGKGLEKWDTSNVENAESMFGYCTQFNADLTDWKVGNIENMSFMFYNCLNFEGKGLENWNTKNTTNMECMFTNCKNFEGKGLENWDVSNVKKMNLMFDNCKSLKNKPSWYKQ